MREAEVPVTFQPLEKTVYVLAGDEAVGGGGRGGRGAGLALRRRGDSAASAACVVAEGAGPPTPAEDKFFSAEELAAGCRLACQMRGRRAH